VANVEGSTLTFNPEALARAIGSARENSPRERVENLRDVVLDQKVAGALYPDRLGGLKSLDPVLGVSRGAIVSSVP